MPIPTLSETFARELGFGVNPGPTGTLVGGLLAAGAVSLILLTNAAVAGPWAKRRVMARIWGKKGPNRMGPFGLLIIAADVVRLISKELIVPERADRPAFDFAPLLVTFSALFGFAVIPMGSGVQVADPATGIVFAFAVASLATLGMTMAGYASNNKFSLLGSLRAIAQNIAYEIPLVVTAASVVLLAGTMRTSEIVAAQQGTLVSAAGLSIPAWYAFVNPFAFVLFVVANLAEVGRNPFDTPEAPTEIVAGFQTEYSSVYFVLLYLGEFLHIFLGAGLIITLFLGGPAGPVLPGIVWFLIKMWAVFLFTQWARSSIPRLRIDQLMGVGWKGMLMLSFANLVLTAVLVAVIV
jgi:NADH-quinone oxidoreductase subunit H